jgi:plasmid replication initiation protein
MSDSGKFGAKKIHNGLKIIDRRFLFARLSRYTFLLLVCSFKEITMTCGQMIPHELVSFSHALLESRYNYNAAEQRLVLLASALVEPNDSGSDYYTIDLKAIKNQYSFGESFYQEMENACESIMKNPVYLKEDHNTKLIVHWFSSMEIDRINKTVTVSFHDLIKPQLFDLKEKFLVFLKSNAVSLTYPSYIRIFLLIKAQEFLGHGGRFYKEMSIDQIKEICVTE